MKKLLCLLLATAMLLSCAYAGAETTDQTFAITPIKATATFAVNQDLLNSIIPMMNGSELDENTQALVNAVVSVLNNAKVELNVQEDGTLVSVKLGDSEILNGVVRESDGKMLVDTTMLPSYTLDITDLLTQLTGEDTVAPDEMIAQATQVAQTYMNDAMTFFQSCMGETVVGDTEIGGVTYASATPITMTVGQFAEFAVAIIDKLQQDEAALELLKNLDQQGNLVAELTQNREQMAQAAQIKGTEQDQTMASGTIFMTQDQSKMAVVIDMATSDTEFSHVVMTMANGENGAADISFNLMSASAYPENGDWTDVASSSDYQGSLSASLSVAGQNAALSLLFDAQGVSIGGSVQYAAQDETGLNNALTCALYFMDTENPLLTVNVASATTDAIQLPAAAEGKTVLTLGAELDETTQQQLALELTGDGLSAVLQNAYAAMPDEMMIILNAMQPAPSEEPAETTTTQPAA